MNSQPKWGCKKRRPVPDLRHEQDAILEKIRARSRVNPETGCWEWLRHKNGVGYATTSWRNRPWMTDRLVLAATIGAFDPDLDACHSCHNRGCVNPAHLRADEHRENLMDGSRAKRLQGQWKTHCLHGHPLSGENLYIWAGNGFRRCRTCTRLRQRERQRVLRLKRRTLRECSQGNSDDL